MQGLLQEFLLRNGTFQWSMAASFVCFGVSRAAKAKHLQFPHVFGSILPWLPEDLGMDGCRQFLEALHRPKTTPYCTTVVVVEVHEGCF